MLKKLMIAICAIAICAGSGQECFAQKKNKKAKEAAKTEAAAKDTTAAPKKPAKKDAESSDIDTLE